MGEQTKLNTLTLVENESPLDTNANHKQLMLVIKRLLLVTLVGAAIAISVAALVSASSTRTSTNDINKDVTEMKNNLSLLVTLLANYYSDLQDIRLEANSSRQVIFHHLDSMLVDADIAKSHLLTLNGTVHNHTRDVGEIRVKLNETEDAITRQSSETEALRNQMTTMCTCMR